MADSRTPVREPRSGRTQRIVARDIDPASEYDGVHCGGD